MLFVCPQANELLFAGRKITAIEAYQLGLVSQVFWPTSMMQDVIPRVQNMAMNSAKVGTGWTLLVGVQIELCAYLSLRFLKTYVGYIGNHFVFIQAV